MDLQMLQRNMGVKRAPERWQDNRDVFDAVVTFDERIMEQLLDGETRNMSPVLRLLPGMQCSHAANGTVHACLQISTAGLSRP